LIGSYFNIPIAELPDQQMISGRLLWHALHRDYLHKNP